MGRNLGIGVGLTLATLAIYSGVLDNPFVSFDDTIYITENPRVQEGLSWQGLRWAFTSFYADNWHPLTWLSHMLDVELFGLEARGHHAVGLLIHTASALLLFALMLTWTGDRWASALAAALFAIHPLRVESVAWASERKDLLAGLFFFLTLIAHTRYARAPSVRAYLVTTSCFAIGLLAKPMLVSLPLILLLVDRWPLDRARQPGAWLRLAAEKLPLLALAAGSSLVTILAQSERGTLQPFEVVPFGDRVANAALSACVYLRQSLWPTDLVFFYPHPSLVETGLPASLGIVGSICGAGLVLLSIAALRLHRTRPWWSVGWLWYLLMLIPVVGIVQVGVQAHADRYTYLSTVGIIIAITWELRERLPRSQPWVAALACVPLIALSLSTLRQVEVWQGSDILYRHAIENTRGNYIAMHNLAADHAERGTLRHAVSLYQQALKARPGHAASHSNLGVILERDGQTEIALKHYRAALQSQPDFYQAHVNLAGYYAGRGDLQTARDHYERALEERPNDSLILINHAVVVWDLDDVDAALASWERAIAIDPESAELQTRFGDALRDGGFEARAAAHYRRALALTPELLPAADGLAWILATSPDPALRDGQEAVRWAELCGRETRNLNRGFLQTLAAAHAEAGDFAQAQKWQSRSIELTPADERALPEERLALYRSGRPLRHEAPKP